MSGVAIALAPHVKFIDVEHHLEGRIMSFRVIIRGIRLTVFSCYAPHEGYAESSNDAFHNSFAKALVSTKKAHPSFKLLVCGDFNATIGTDCIDSDYVGLYNDSDPTSFNGTKLIETAQNNGLYILNTMFPTKSSAHRWTFKSPLGYYRRLDYILGEWYVKRASQNCRSYPAFSKPFDSDHRVVVLDVNFPSKRSNKKLFAKKYIVKKPAIPNVRTLREDECVRTKYIDQLGTLLETPPSPASDMNDVEQQIVSAISTASANTIPTKERKEDIKPWVNPEFLTLLKNRHQSKSDIEHAHLSKEIRRMRTQLKNKYFKQKADSINNASELRNTEEEFRLAKNYTSLKKSSKIPIQPDKLKDHFEKHFGDRQFQPHPELTNPNLFPHILPTNNEPAVYEDPLKEQR